jgi:menaquinone-dependent protoporphyrinogen oxidase
MAASPRVLVAYASAAGSTAGVAERIADVLGTAGCSVVCRPAGPDVDLDGFDALLVGSAVHDMAWLPSAVDVLRRAAAASASRPVWCFSVGGVNPQGAFTRYLTRKEAQRDERRFPVGLTLREHRVFGGVVDLRGAPWWSRLMYRLAGTRAGDRRDWPAIEAWARNIAAALTTPAAVHDEVAMGRYGPPKPPAGW